MNVYYIIDYVVRTREYSFCFGSVNYINLDQQIFKDFISNLIFRKNIKNVKKNISFLCSKPSQNKDFLSCAVCVICVIIIIFFCLQLTNYALASATGPSCCHGLDHGLKILKSFESDFECFVSQRYSIRDLYYIC